jgi:pullulanase
MVLDPYAKCVIGKTKRCKIIDLASFPKPFLSNTNLKREDTVIYEIHLRDISIDNSSGCENNGKYLALTERDTYLNKQDKNISTLTEHFLELGVNTLQIMPLQDFDNAEEKSEDYHWGYMPSYFDTPDGCYASDWQTEAKIHEVKQMVDYLHSRELKIILDVVYNHTSEGFFGEGVYSFNAFVPYYYYRFGKGYISNGSGCGNELRSEAPMVRKFLLDSLKFWVEFYGFDGFRFDLMGLIDIDTLSIIVKELKKIKSDIFIYGEPWTGGLTPIQPTYKGMQKDKDFAVFNDDFRDALKGSVGNQHDKGYVQTNGEHNYDKIIQGIMGSINTFTSSPLESLNYVEIHDNHTLFDKLYFTLSGKDTYKEPDHALLTKIIALHKLSAFIFLTSQGIPVLHLGQDFLRTKQGIDNSYNSGDKINKINWQRKKDYHSVFTYYKNLITMRKDYSLLRINSTEKIASLLEFKYDIFPKDKCKGISYLLYNNGYDTRNYRCLLVLINPYAEEIKIKNIAVNYKKLVFGDDFYSNDPQFFTGEVVLPSLSGNILIY